MMCLGWEPRRTCVGQDCKGLWFFIALAAALFAGGTKDRRAAKSAAARAKARAKS